MNDIAREYPLKDWVQEKLSSDHVDKVVEERGHTHGSYQEGARVIQSIKRLFHQEPGWMDLDACQKESMDMIATKCGRILCGDQNAIQHWEDLGGYSKLIIDRIKARK